jgi:hypothetical protein
MSVAFNYGFLALWFTEYGEREGMKRYMSDFEVDQAAVPAGTSAAEAPPAVPPSVAPPA